MTAYVHHAPDRLAVIEAFVEDAVALANNESPAEPTDGRPPLKKEAVPLAYRVQCNGRSAVGSAFAANRGMPWSQINL